MNRNWMTRAAVLAVGAAGLLGTGCSTMNNTERGTLTGIGVGSVGGALAGKALGNPKTGAVLGAVAGGFLGNAIGQDADRKEERAEAIQNAAAVQAYRDTQPQRISEVVTLTQQGQDESVILNHIKTNRMTFSLSVDDLNTLKANNVSPRVIAAMQNSSAPGVASLPPPKTTVVREQVIVREPVYVAPPPPIMVVDPYAPPNRVYIRGRF